jgi:hypothetical protein
VLRPGGHLLVVFPSYFQPIEHHLTLATGSPCLQWVFDGGTLIEAYRQILADRPDAAWYARTHGLEEWERGNTINGTTGRQFAQLIRDQGWGVQLHPRLPIGAVGRRTSSGKGRVLARVCGPLTRAPGLREAVTHRITYILRRPD